MVEGPGTTRNSQKASRMLHAKVLDIKVQSTSTSGGTTTVNHNDIQKMNGTPASESPVPSWWTNRELSEVIKIGKELFLVFSKISSQDIFSTRTRPCTSGASTRNNDINNPRDQDLALRLHFGMVGSLQINNSSTAPRTNKGGQSEATLEITFDTQKVLRTYSTTISKPINAKAARLKFSRLNTHDVCSPTFCLRHVLDQLQQIRSSGGVNHHHTNGHEHTRQYNWYTGAKPSTIISDILLNQNILPGIGNVIKVEGMHEARIHPQRTLQSLSRSELEDVISCSKEYAMKWLRSGKSPIKFVYNESICGTCIQRSVRICRVGGTNRTTFWCGNCQTMENASISISTITQAHAAAVRASEALAAGGEHEHENENEYALQERMNHESSPITNVTNIGPTQQSQSQSSSSTQTKMIRKVCPTHGPSSVILRRCKKKGINEQRIFYTCKSRGCNFFCWADGGFPTCKCHGANKSRAVLRISKTNKTGGRWFFFCAKRKGESGGGGGGGGRSGGNGNGCGYFQWAEDKYLDRYGHLLTPLL